jgi:hypothetical protein
MEFHDKNCKVTRYPDIAEADIYPLFAPAENLIDVILGKAPNRSPASLGIGAMEMIEAAVVSQRERRNVPTVAEATAHSARP